MLNTPRIRRPIAALLMMLGAALMYLTLETWAGIMLFVLGMLIEAAGIAIRHKS